MGGMTILANSASLRRVTADWPSNLNIFEVGELSQIARYEGIDFYDCRK